MSGIVGFFNRDGRPVDPSILDRMMEAISYRGPDGARVWSGGPVALGHLMLHTTPESLREIQPLHYEKENLCLVMDGRIDNREELKQGLVSAGIRLPDDTDAELVLCAYTCWGEEFASKLLGDFSLAIWDGRNRRLFCCRDHLGVKPFYYYLSKDLFVFGSEIRAVLAQGAVPKSLDEERIADYLVDQLDRERPEATFYQFIARLRGGHHMEITAKGSQKHDYWRLKAPPERKGTLGECAEELREIFVKAVHCRLRSAFPVGAGLSGGLDSSAVVCTIRKLLQSDLISPLRTISLIDSDESKCLETPYIRQIIAGGWIVPRIVGSNEAPKYWENIRHAMSSDAEPWEGKYAYFNRVSYEIAGQTGVRVLLSGIDGDLLGSPRLEYLLTLLKSFRLRNLWRDIKSVQRDYEIPLLRILQGYILAPLIPNVLGFLHRLRRPTYAGRIPHSSFISAEFAHRTKVVERCRLRLHNIWEQVGDVGGLHRLNFITDLLPSVYEGHDQLGAEVRVEPRHPYSDVRLVNFFLSLPLEYKTATPKPKTLMRLAMKNLVPENVRARISHRHPAPWFLTNFSAEYPPSSEGSFRAALTHVSPYVSVEKAVLAWKRGRSGSWRDVWEVNNVLALSIWLESLNL